MRQSAYNIQHWGAGYFDVDHQGNVVVHPQGSNKSQGWVLADLVNQLIKQGLSLPILIRFIDILHDRLAQLHQAFADARAKVGYEGDYISVYPIKVNQQKQVISELIRPDAVRALPGHVGLEAGSKPELLAVLGLASPGRSVIICNGYKDSEYIRLALIGQQMGHRVYIIIERLAELKTVLTQAAALNLTPQLGVRVRLNVVADGRWQNSGGEKSKFGLSARQVLQLVETLNNAGQLSTLVLLHCHMGSQIANIKDIQNGLLEVSRYYTQLRSLGAPIAFVDIGGGLGIDYSGLRSRQGYSINYSLQEYANNVVSILHEACQKAKMPAPSIITETGRALVAHHAVLVTNIIEVERPLDGQINDQACDQSAPAALQYLWEKGAFNPDKSPLEMYHDIDYWMDEAKTQYTHGIITLKKLAETEQLYLQACARIAAMLTEDNKAHRQLLESLSNKLSDKLFANFSVFQSLPDVWAINQTFPIMPLTGLNRPLNYRATVHDITCDSDGCIREYVATQSLAPTLPVPDLQTEEANWLGVFLVGAYQEILGDMHNLFGDTHAVNVEVDEAGQYHIGQIERGDTVSDVLRYVHLDLAALRAQYQRQFEQTHLKPAEKEALLTELLAGLDGYTYLED